MKNYILKSLNLELIFILFNIISILLINKNKSFKFYHKNLTSGI